MDVEGNLRDRSEQKVEKRHRGKLYLLSEVSAWEDKGTGLVSIIAADEGKRLIVRDENSDVLLHDRPVLPNDDCYRLQGEGAAKSILVWEDVGLEKDCALSFQDAESAQEIFSELCGEKAKRLLPFPEVEHLPELARALTFVLPSQKEALANECLDERFIAALRQAFHTAEDSHNPQDLMLLWRIARGVFMLANHALTRRYMRHDIFEDTMGMLEFDEGLPEDRRICHRQVLKVAVRFKQVLSFQDAELLERIHLNYRLQYLKDYALARVLDDAALASLTQLVIMNNNYLLDYLRQNDALLSQLFDGLKNKDMQSLLFLQDACRLAKTMPPSERKLLYEKMMQHQLFSVLQQFLTEEPEPKDGTEGPVPRHMAMEVLALSTLSDASHLRRYLLGGQKEVPAFLGNLICLLLADPDHGVQSQVADVLQLVMDPSQVAPKSRAAFLDALYSHGVLEFIAKPLIDLTDIEAEADTSRLSSSGCFAIQTICELLAFAVASHGQRPEALIKKNSLAQKALVVAAASGHKYLQLAPIRLVKAMTKAEDHMYLFHMLETGVFGVILKILEQSCQPPSMGGGLLAAAVSELLEVIRLQNAKPLVWHICTEYEGILRSLAPRLKVAEALLARHEKNREEEAERRHKAKASNALRRMAQGHQLDETEQGATDVPKSCAEAQDSPTVEEVEDDSVAGKNFAEIFGADADDADSDFSDSDDEEEEEEAVEADASDSSTSEEEGLFRGRTPQALMLLIRKAVDEEDEDTVRKALRVAWREGAHPDEKDAEFLSQLRDWLGEDEALNALILQNGLQREMAMEEVLGPQDDDSPPDHPEPATSTALEGEVKMASEVATGRAPKTQSRRGAPHLAISRLQAERCRNFIASPKVDASGDRSGRRNSKLPEGKGMQEEPPGRRSLSHASKRARKETPAIPA